jgi:hypothetical protein
MSFARGFRCKPLRVRRRRLLPSAQGCPDVSGLPWVIKSKQIPTLKGLRIGSAANDSNLSTNSTLVGAIFGNPFRVAISCSLITQSSRATHVNPGLEMVNAFGVHVLIATLNRLGLLNVCRCPNKGITFLCAFVSLW